MVDIYLDLRPTILQYLAGLGASPADAEDIWHDGWIRFTQRYDGKRKPLNFGVQICKNLLHDKRKKLKVINGNSKEISHNYRPELSPEQELIMSQERVEKHRQILNELRGRQYTVARMCLEGYSYPEICSTLGISRQKIYKTMSAIYKELR